MQGTCFSRDKSDHVHYIIFRLYERHRDVGWGPGVQLRGVGKSRVRKSDLIRDLRLSLCHSCAGPRPCLPDSSGVADSENTGAAIYDDIRCSLTSRSRAVRVRSSRPCPARSCPVVSKRRAIGFARRTGLASLGAPEWPVRPAPATAPMRRTKPPSTWLSPVQSRPARGRTGVNGGGFGFARRRGLASLGAAGLASLGASTHRTAPRDRRPRSAALAISDACR